MKKVYLILQNGQIFQADSFGATGDITAEIVFTTGMEGYLETLTDPSYHGQMVVQTFPLIGNYGVIPEDFESAHPSLSAYIVRDICEIPSNFRCEGNLSDYLAKTGVIGLCNLDTRALTKIIREFGVMNAAIRSELPENMELFTAELSLAALSSSVDQVTCKESYVLNPEGEKHVVLWDYGFKKNMGDELIKRGCKLTVVPADTTAEAIKALNPDGILLSNGPGDPSDNKGIISEISKIAPSGIPIFGICLGHQMLALAKGAISTKLKYGHRGANQPVCYTPTGRLYITSQNHGYAIKSETLPKSAVLSFTHVNDDTCEGVEYADIPAFSVQFHPEACGGPKDTNFLFDQFMNMMGGQQ
ncbi:carbamoyl phosphate synthase small subunit [Chakrabartyella piscis]|uniref:carbamoyl phosphate synthase small subunit n=1 Tax=Chakrabartyella piscis TaxID=2918914 RepID=UPI00295840F7|nr:carbamoyl phosphate synthase small subunit [Chakrabartyella piscis]